MDPSNKKALVAGNTSEPSIGPLILEVYALDNLQVPSESQPETRCMYCWLLKPASDMTLEHAIPQSLGGAQSPQRYKVRAACGKCNSSLGLHVDASFEKSWLPSIALGEAARHLSERNDKVVPPLVCTGIIHLNIPGLLESEVCEWWTGSQGENVFLIRPVDEERYWYMGGNPIALKQLSANARAYYFFNESADPNRSLLEFKESFKRRKVRKISGTSVSGVSLLDHGFSAPDEADSEAIEWIWSNVFSGESIKGAVPFNSEFDTRFMCKLALAVAYCEFGEGYLETDYAKLLHTGLWHRGEGGGPDIPGARPFNAPVDETLKKYTCDHGAVSLLIMPSGEYLLLTLNINQKHTWTIAIAAKAELTSEEVGRFTNGKLLMLFGPTHTFYEIDFLEYLSSRLHP